MMKTHLTNLAPTLFLLSTLGSAAELTIIHSSDVHGRLSPVRAEGREQQGGLAKRAHFVEQMRQQEENLLVLDSGDYFQGTIYYDLYGGRESARLMKHAGIDAMALGNHEFNADEAGLRVLMELAETPFLCANVTFTEPYVRENVKPYLLREIDGARVLIIGVTTPELTRMTKSQSITVHDARPCIESIAREVAHDYLIVLSHCGFEYDQGLLEQVPAIDLILGGHDHYRLVFHSPQGVIAHHGSYGTQLGVLRVDTERKTLDARLVAMDEEISHDPAVDEEMRYLDARVDELKAQRVAHAHVALRGEEELIESQQTNLGQLVLKSMASAFDSYDVLLVQAGSIRLYRELKGDISYADVMQILPFKGQLVRGLLTGRELKSILAKGKKAGESYLHVQIKQGDIESIEDERLYSVITNDYLAAGKDGYEEFLQMRQRESSSRDCFEILFEFLKENREVTERSYQF